MTVNEKVVKEINDVALIRNLILSIYNSNSMIEAQIKVAQAMISVDKKDLIRIINMKVDMKEIGFPEKISLFQFGCICGDFTIAKFLFESGGNIADKLAGKLPHEIVREVAVTNQDREFGVLSVSMEERYKFIRNSIMFLFLLFFVFVFGVLFLIFKG